MTKFRIDSTFKTFGAFWDYKQPEKKFTGSLSSRKGVIDLKSAPEYATLGSEGFGGMFADLVSPPDLLGVESVCGFTQKVNRCTLLNPLRLHGGGLTDGITGQKVMRIRYQPVRTLMGLHVESSKAMVLDGAAYYLTKIHHLLPCPWEFRITEQDGLEYTVANKAREVFKFSSGLLDADIVCEVSAGGRSHRKSGVLIKPVPRIRITPRCAQSVDWFTALAFRIENFFSLMLGTSPEIKHIELFQGDDCGWIVQKVKRKKEKVDQQAWVRCKFEDTAKALEKWLETPQDDQLVELTLLGMLRKSKLYEETTFLTLAQALEGFGRIRFGGAHRRKPTFKNLIQSTYDLFTPTTAQQVAGERDVFANTIIQTRDYYTHIGNNKGSSATKTMKDLFLLDKRLQAFLRGAILLDLGIPENTFSEAIVRQATRWR